MNAVADTTAQFTAEFPNFTTTWNRLDGIAVTADEVTGNARVTIDPDKWFFRYENPQWILCDWDQVRDDLLPQIEKPGVAIEQIALDYVAANGRETTNPVEVLTHAWNVYDHLFCDDLLDDPELDWIPTEAPTMLRECSVLMALNRVNEDGHIANASPAWMLCKAMEVVYDLDEKTATAMDEFYHSGWFNEHRRRESLLAHAALGGRLVHGCQSAANMSGGCRRALRCRHG
ncbi:hypothetical protein [Haloglycomyces albus]|uniref:hypothetical protein n=1 Tax=Haloglycomyces albus TaxID=526067 RepID=UPI0004BB682A|nr:hypothetical protein [Haloglycomyces albus]